MFENHLQAEETLNLIENLEITKIVAWRLLDLPG